VVTFNDVLRIVTVLLSGSPAYDRQKIAETALHAWLDTLAPESREAVFSEWVQRMRFKMEHGG
jgi:uncharacterized protein (UPF0297 family)